MDHAGRSARLVLAFPGGHVCGPIRRAVILKGAMTIPEAITVTFGQYRPRPWSLLVVCVAVSLLAGCHDAHGSRPQPLAAGSGGSAGAPAAIAGHAGAAGTNVAGSRATTCRPHPPAEVGLPDGPQGRVRGCFGTGCPHGPCSSILSTQCNELYPAPITSESTFCSPQFTGAYCFEVGPDPDPLSNMAKTWFIQCDNGSATVQFCGCCGAVGKNPAQCPP